ncbi:MAG: hypothetical protein WBP61_11425 [Nocardioides sp.]
MSPQPPYLVVAAAALAPALALLGPSASAAQPADPVDPTTISASSRVTLEQLTVVGDGRVSDVVRSGDRIYALGSFEEVGPYTGPGRILDAGTGADLPAPRFDDGQVSVALADGAGGWYVAGDIRGGVVHVRADGSEDPAFDVEADGLVSAIARVGDTLYLGGLFSEVNGSERGNLAAVSALSGDLLPFRSDLGSRVTELVHAPAADGLPATLYAGGSGVAVIDPVTGEAGLPLGGFDGPVRALALGGERLYVGSGDLDAVDRRTGSLIDDFTPSVSGADSSVHTLLLTDDRLYVGSDATTIAGSPGRLVALDPESGAADRSFDPGVGGGEASFGRPGGVFDLALDDGRLWVAGAFDGVGGEAADGLVVLDAASGAASDTDVPRFHQQVNTVEVSGGAAYVGGHFYLDDPVRTKRIAALDAATLEPVPGFRGRGSWHHGELVVAPNAVYVGVTHQMGFVPKSRGPYYPDTTSTVRAYDPATGRRDPQRTHRVKDLTGVTTRGRSLVVAQRLQDDVRFPRNRITVYRPDGRKARSFRVPLRGYITEIATVRGDLLLAGSFRRTSTSGGPRNTAMIRIDPTTGKRRAWFDPRIHGPVQDVSVWGKAIYASGLFTRVHQGSDQARPGLTKMDLRSRVIERFQPQILGGHNVFQGATAVGDLVFSTAYPQTFLDARTGDAVADPTGMLEDVWLSAATGTSETLVVGGRQWTSLAGEGSLEVGFVAAYQP